MKFSCLLLCALFVSLCLLGPLPTALAVTWTGNVNPNDPTTWNSSTTGYIGETADGTLTVGTNNNLKSSNSIIGYTPGVTGQVTIAGANATWTNGGYLWVGFGGSGILNITDGGAVGESNGGVIGSTNGSKGTIVVDGADSKWTNASYLFVGSGGSGTLSITSGGAVSCSGCSIGNAANSTSVVTVDGNGSKLTDDNSYLFVGDHGIGQLNITGGGSVASRSGNIGVSSGSEGVVRIDGANSTWTDGGYLYVGDSGSGMLSITNSGKVTATSVSVNNTSLLAIDIGNGSCLNLGKGLVTNYGTMRFVAGCGAETGTYKPIVAGVWTGTTGRYQALGGTWNADHTFTVSSVQEGMSGTPVFLETQRVLVNDSKTGWAVGASFAANSMPTAFTATAISGDVLRLLGDKLIADTSVLSGWTFSATGYTTGNPVYLSMLVGAGQTLDSLTLWHYDNATGWKEYTSSATDLNYDGSYVNFTVTSFSGYAVSGIAVPEPSAIMLLTIGLGGILAYVWRKRSR